jgi:hypothetical protein
MAASAIKLVTPEMIEAGVSVYEGWTDTHERTTYMEGVVRDIYRAMRALDPEFIKYKREALSQR